MVILLLVYVDRDELPGCQECATEIIVDHVTKPKSLPGAQTLTLTDIIICMERPGYKATPTVIFNLPLLEWTRYWRGYCSQYK